MDINLLVDTFLFVMVIISFILFFYSLVNKRKKVDLLIGIVNVTISFVIFVVRLNVWALFPLVLSIYPLIKYQILGRQNSE